MVQVRDHHPLHDDGDVCIDQWVTNLLDKVAEGSFSREVLVAACELALEAESSNNHITDQVWASTVSSFRTGQEMAEILTELHLYDQDSLVASILYRAVREGRLDIESVQEQFGESVTTLIEGVRKMAVISTLRADGDGDVFGHVAAQQATKVREMLVSIIDDVRVALIKIAERTCAIRALKTASNEKRLRVAREIFDVYAPLAHRLGIGQLKWELEDLAFRYLETDEYMRIARLLDERRMDRQQYIKELISTLEMELSTADIKGEIAGRAKHIYSIWRKMHRKDIGFSQIHDIRAVRVLVPTIADCYTLLGIVHSHWRNIHNEFDDYIATPKENGYRSLHTAVIGPHRKVLEIQIRTYEMHRMQNSVSVPIGVTKVQMPNPQVTAMKIKFPGSGKYWSGTKKLKVIMLRNYSALIMVLTEFTSLHQKVMWLILPWVPRLSILHIEYIPLLVTDVEEPRLMER